jgi:hypothetical protein
MHAISAPSPLPLPLLLPLPPPLPAIQAGLATLHEKAEALDRQLQKNKRIMQKQAGL